MDFQLTEDQAALVSAVHAIVQDHMELPRGARLASHYYDTALQRLLEDNGFLNAGRELGALGAALVIDEVARIPAVVEVAATALVVPRLLGEEQLEGPVALLSARALAVGHRFLSVARTALIDLGEDIAVVPIAPGDAEPVDSILAYPIGRFTRLPDLTTARRLRGKGAPLRQWWRVGLAIEFAGAAQSAVGFTLNYVKQRHVFGHPVGAFQTVQHRLVQCQMVANAGRLLALRAAWSGEAYHADLAACHVQQHVRKLLVDLHQFTGAMGVTNEFLLHFWTYRLRALQAEAGGLGDAALGIARHRWSGTAAPVAGAQV
jgi:alkylation response protein AidB-like acyl-CoA dehydrogenase